MPDPVRLVGTIEVAAPRSEAFVLFTPLGERLWADGWDPRFAAAGPDGAPPDDTAPGTVFTTAHDGVETTWVVTAREPGRSIGYARVTPHERAGTVRVRCADTDAGHTRVEVEYHLTALSPDGARWLAEFAAGYDAYLRSWQEAIAALPGDPPR